MQIESLASLQAADERTCRFTPLGLGIDRMLTAEAAADYHQRALGDVNLVGSVPEGVLRSFERVCDCYRYGVLWYDAFTVASDHCFMVLEYALRTRFLEHHQQRVPLDCNGQRIELKVTKFEELIEHQQRHRRRKGDKCQLVEGTRTEVVPTTLRPLLRWARRNGLLPGQRSRSRDALTGDMRNLVAHGSTGTSLLTPIMAAGDIRGLAETINQLWGHRTPGGRLYPAPLQRQEVIIAHNAGRSALIPVPLERPLHLDLPGEGWECTVVLGVVDDPHLRYFERGQERTRYACDWLFGPAGPSATVAWLEQHTIAGDTTDPLDRRFLVRALAGVITAHAETTAVALAPSARVGTWTVLIADEPFEAIGHVRDHKPVESSGCDCPVTVLRHGTWKHVVSGRQST